MREIIPPEEIMRTEVHGKEVTASYREYKLTPQTRAKLFSRIGVQVISEIEQHGYKVLYIKEFITNKVDVDKEGKIAYVVTPDVLGATLPQGKMVVFSKNAIDRARRKNSYYRKILSDATRLKAWKKKHDNQDPPITPLSWPELLIHELAHIIVIERNLSDCVKWKLHNELYESVFFSKSPDISLMEYLHEKMHTLMHGRDFRRVYKSLCRKYGVEPDYKEQVEENEQNR